MPVSFPEKEQIYHFIYNIEEQRNNLIYGKNSPLLTKEILENFIQLKKILLERLEELGEKIE